MIPIRLGKSDDDRRFKIAFIPGHALMSCLRDNTRLPDDCINRISFDVPEGTEIVERYYDASRMAEAIIMYHPSWDVVPVGECVPIIPVEYKRVTVNLSESHLNMADMIEVWDRYLTMLQARQRQRIIREIECKTKRVVHSIQYDPRKQQYRVLAEDGSLLDIIQDTDERLKTVSIARQALEFITRSSNGKQITYSP